jgi:hypothetical protein
LVLFLVTTEGFITKQFSKGLSSEEKGKFY